MIELTNIKKAYNSGGKPLPVLKGISLHIAEGEMVSIMGSSGSGKSTLLNVLGILDHFDSGQYTLANTNIGRMNERKAARLRNLHIGFVFQSFNLLPFKTAVENVALPLYYRGESRRIRNRKAAEMLERVGLSDRAQHMPNQLSGGQNQRVAIARALVTHPSVILADEPTGALDSTTSEQILNLFETLHAEGLTVVMVTHDDEVAQRTPRIIRLRDGLISG